MKTFIIAEIGINHNGSLEITKQLIKEAAEMGCDAVKFQKRTLDEVYSKEDLDRPRQSPWGTTNRQQKEGLEFGLEEYQEIDEYCKQVGIEWLASAWDVNSQKFLRQFNLKYNKIASALLTHTDLLKQVASEGRHTFISTGMSTMDEIATAVSIFRIAKCPFELMHCNSTYPMKNEDANLLVMNTLRDAFECNVGYSGHETGRVVSLTAVALGATSLERHITLDRTMYGSDQAASIEMGEMRKLVSDVRTVEESLGSEEKVVHESEKPIRDKLRNF
jgi:N-acetylneuraminate synthase